MCSPAADEAECASDLRLDRWLLGESPGSDEARRLEKHLTECAECASRRRCLRSLHSATVPAAPSEPMSARVSAAGLLQVIILRDGLLVGTEMFTSGRWSIGAEGADLCLEGLPPQHQTVLRFHDGRVSIHAEQGPVYVTGQVSRRRAATHRRALHQPVDASHPVGESALGRAARHRLALGHTIA